MRRVTVRGSFVEVGARLLWLFGGCIVLGFGIVLAVKTAWGPAAWDVLHLALAERTGLTLGQVSIATSLVIISLTVVLGGGWTVRWGTIVNTVVIGVTIDVVMRLGIPDAATLPSRLLYVVLAMFSVALGSVLYTRAGYGAGARDGLILVLSQRIPFTVGRIRLGLEALICFVGWLLGGPIGPATALIALGTGPTADLIYRVLGRGYLPESVRIPERAA